MTVDNELVVKKLSLNDYIVIFNDILLKTKNVGRVGKGVEGWVFWRFMSKGVNKFDFTE